MKNKAEYIFRLRWFLDGVFRHEAIPVGRSMTDETIRRVLEENSRTTNADFHYCVESAQKVDGYLGNVVVHLTRSDYTQLVEELNVKSADDFTAFRDAVETALIQLLKQGAADRLLTHRYFNVPKTARNCSQYDIGWTCAENGPVIFDITLRR